MKTPFAVGYMVSAETVSSMKLRIQIVPFFLWEKRLTEKIIFEFESWNFVHVFMFLTVQKVGLAGYGWNR